jgi:hypothetical protein
MLCCRFPYRGNVFVPERPRIVVGRSMVEADALDETVCSTTLLLLLLLLF